MAEAVYKLKEADLPYLYTMGEFALKCKIGRQAVAMRFQVGGERTDGAKLVNVDPYDPMLPLWVDEEGKPRGWSEMSRAATTSSKVKLILVPPKYSFSKMKGGRPAKESAITPSDEKLVGMARVCGLTLKSVATKYFLTDAAGSTVYSNRSVNGVIGYLAEIMLSILEGQKG